MEEEDKMPESESEPLKRFLVGYALPERKKGGFFKQPTFIKHAKDQGIDFVPIDVGKPLAGQAPFDCIVHKLYNQEWKLNLHDFMAENPKTVVIDPPSAIERLRNRISMLDFVTELKIPNLTIPNQLVVSADSSSFSSVIASGKLKFPIIAKPVVVDGSTKSHKMSLVLNQEGLLDLQPPVVLQQFVNHGGVIFKVYVAGDCVECVKRRSLKDISPEKLEKVSSESPGGVICFSQISNSAIANDDDDDRSTEDSDGVEMPPAEFVSETANRLRRALGLHLFNFDMITDEKGSGYLVIDINYFPGFEKLPSFETFMTDFFLNLKKSHTVEKTTTAGSGCR